MPLAAREQKAVVTVFACAGPFGRQKDMIERQQKEYMTTD